MSSEDDLDAEVERIVGEAVGGRMPAEDAVLALDGIRGEAPRLSTRVRAASALSLLLSGAGDGAGAARRPLQTLDETAPGSRERWSVEVALTLTHLDRGDRAGARAWASRAMGTLVTARCDHGTFLVTRFLEVLGDEEPTPEEARDADALVRMTWDMTNGREPRPGAPLRDRVADLWDDHLRRGHWSRTSPS